MERANQAPLAVIGMACRVPGADGLEEFWRLLVEGGCGIVEAPPERLNRQLYYDPRRGIPCKTYTLLGGLIQYPPFDGLRCPAPQRILPSAEIGHVTICQIAAQACRHAGMDPFDLPLRNVGVYVGHNLGGPIAGDIAYATMVEETAQYLRELEGFREAVAGSEDRVIEAIVEKVRRGLPRRGLNGVPVVAARMGAAIISEAFGLTGPTMILDAACSSALQGLAMAVRALRLGRIDMAIVGGATYYHVDSLMLFSKAQSASANGSCPFDASADGLVSSEGYVAIVVKTLERALADGDPICGVIRGIGVSSDGRGKGLWAPRKEGQVLAIRRAYEAGLDIGRLQYIEAHATSTRVGDLTEMEALAEVFCDCRLRGGKIAMGGVKANIGHTLEAAGLAGFVKTLLAMRHKTIPQQIRLRQLNPGIDWNQAPFYVPTTNTPWPEFQDGHPRRAAVNSFGIGGLNVHVVLDEYQECSSRRAAGATPQAPAVQEPVAIVGAACIFPGARTLDAFWELLVSQRDPKCDVPGDRWSAAVGYEPQSQQPWRSPTKRGGFITDFQYDWRRHKAPPKQVAHADPLQLMILDATDAALADAGYDKRPYDKSRVGVVVGTVFGSDFCEQLQMGFRLPDFCATLAEVLRGRGVPEDAIAAISQAYCDALLAHMPALLDETGGFTPSTLASRVTKTYDLMGGAAAVDAGQASSLAAVYSAVDSLLDRSCDMVVCAAGHRAMGLSVYAMLSLAGKLADDCPKAPFDAAADGYLPGEGVGVLLLKRLADADRDGDPIRGVIRGVGAGFSASRREAVSQAIRRAYHGSGQTPREMVLLETAGEANAETDNQEIAALAEACAGGSRRRPLLLGSVVAKIGHTEGTSGMASLLAAICAMQELRSPATFGATTPAPALNEPGSPLQLASTEYRLTPSETDGRVLAGINSTDSLGAAYHLVVERGGKAATAKTVEPSSPSVRAAAPGNGRIVRIAAATLPQLVKRTSRAVEAAGELFGRADSVRFDPGEPWRLAIVAESACELEEKLKQAAQRLGSPTAATLARKDIYQGKVTGRVGKVAFLFSGQGSQYAGMLRPLIEEYPPAAEAMRQIDAALRRLELPTFAEVAWEHGDRLGADVWFTQLSVLCADMIVFHSLQAMGIRPDFVAGHSYGEFPALAAVGAWDFASAVQATRARCQAIEACPHIRGGMLSIAAAGALVEHLCQEVEGRVYLANYNAPDQTVAGGETDAIARLAQRLRAEKIASTVLPVPRPFHTPLMEDVKAPLARGLGAIPLQTPGVPMFSSVTNRLLASPEEIRAALVAQMTSPVRYVDLIKQLVKENVGAIVEVGPRQILTALHNRILAGLDVAAIACDDKKRGGFTRLLAVQACLETLGLFDRPAAPPALDVFAAAGQPVATFGPPNGTTDHAAGPPEAAEAMVPCTECEGDEESATVKTDREVLVLAGSPYEMGRRHGIALAAQIRAIARRQADMAGGGFDAAHESAALTRNGAVAAQALLPEEREELQGIADGAGVSVETLAVYNVWLDSRGADHATHFPAPEARGIADLMQDFTGPSTSGGPWRGLGLVPGLRVHRPSSGLAHVVTAWPGEVGGLSGINESGIVVSSVSATSERSPSQPGEPLRTALVRRLLHNAAHIEAAIALLRDTPGKAGWSFCITHGQADRIYEIRWDKNGKPLAPDCRVMARSDAVCQLGALAEARFGVVMKPSRAEITLRSTTETGLEMVHSYRLSPAVKDSQTAAGQTAAGQAAERIAGDRLELPAVPAERYLRASQSVDGRPPFDLGGRVCSRFVLRMLRSPLPEIEDSLGELNGPSMIVGRNPVGLALRKQIIELGGKAVIVPLADDPDKTLRAVETIWQAYRPPHLFLVTPFDEDATATLESSDWERRRRRGVMLPYLICQKWFALVSANKMVEQASVAAATAMGGDFGLSGRMESPESGAITGLVKALCIEVGYTTDWAFRTKVVDAPRSEPPEEVASAVLRELRAISFFAEIGYAGGQRYVIGALHEPAKTSPRNTPTAGRPWLVTGGARGITAAVAHELGSRFGVKLHLLGASPKPQIDAAWRNLTPEGQVRLRAELTQQALAEKRVPNELWRQAEKAIEIDQTLRKMEAAGLAAVYHSCDVSDRDAMSQLLGEIRRADGPLEGIVHGAGIESACRFVRKSRQLVEKTIAAKVDGAAVLMHLTRNDPLRFFFGFGSVSGRWGSIGQTDYGLASDMLCKLVDWYRTQRPECCATCFHWQPWAEIGMAARYETRGANVLQQLKLLPASEGRRHFVDELLAGAPEPEVLITDWGYYKAFHPDISDKEAAKTYCLTATQPPTAASPAPPAVAPRSAGDSPREPAATGSPGPVAMRHVMRMVTVPWEQTSRRAFSFAGAAAILGDNADAVALGKRLAGHGVEVRYHAIRDSSEETVTELERIWTDKPALHLFLMTGRDPEAAQIGGWDAWLRRYQRGVMLPLLVCRRWVTLVTNADLRSKASLAAATSLGGDFGFAQPVVAPEGGALTGLLKGLYLELGANRPGGMRVKIVDAPPDEPPPRLAEAIVRELDVEGTDVEAACCGGARSVVRLVVQPLNESPREEFRRGGVWVFTGGARGITAAVAKEMGRRYGLRLHLLGKSEPPQLDPAWRDFGEEQLRQLKRALVRKAAAEGKPYGAYWDRVRKDLEIDKNLRDLAAAGIQGTYHSCDVTDWAELDRTLQRIRATDGPIEGVVHGAGIDGPAKAIDEESMVIASKLMETKVGAAMALMLLTRDDPLSYFVGFGSISGRFGSPHAASYTLSSDLLCKLIGWQRSQRPQCRSVGFHWHPWGEVGMMTRPVAQHTTKVMKMKMMPPGEGAGRLIEELRAGAPESEVLITDSQFYETFFGKELVISSEAGERTRAARPVGALIERVLEIEPGRRSTVQVRLDPLGDPFLREHRLRDKPTLPMVVAVEAFAEAAALLAGGEPTVACVRDVRIQDALRCFSERPFDACVRAEATDKGVQCRLTSDFRNRRGQLVQKDRMHFSAIVELGAKTTTIGAERPAMGDDWFELNYPPPGALLYHGPPLRLLKRMAIDESGGWGEIRLAEENELAGARDPAGWLTPSAAIDACYYACGVYTWVLADHGVTVPERLAVLQFGRPARPSETALVRLVCRELADRFGVFDFTLFGDDGTVILQAQEYRCHILRGGGQ